MLCQASVAKKEDTPAEGTYRKVYQHKMTHDGCACATSCSIALVCMIVRDAASVHLIRALRTKVALQPCLAYMWQFQPSNFTYFAWQFEPSSNLSRYVHK